MYTLTDSEVTRFLELLDAVKTEPLPPRPTLDGARPCGVRIVYPDHTDFLTLPQFILNGSYQKATAGAQELIDYVNNLKFYTELDYRIIEDLPERYYIVGREDGVVQIEIYSSETGASFYLNSEEVDRFLRELDNVSFVPTNESFPFDSPSDITFVVKRLDHLDLYNISDVWAKNQQVCKVSVTKEFMDILYSLIAEHSPR